MNAGRGEEQIIKAGRETKIRKEGEEKPMQNQNLFFVPVVPEKLIFFAFNNPIGFYSSRRAKYSARRHFPLNTRRN